MTAVHIERAGEPAALTALTPAFPVDRLRPGVTAASAPKFGDTAWRLGLLDHSGSAQPMTIIWSTFPRHLEEDFRVAAWLMLNDGVDPALLDRRGLTLIEHPAPSTAHGVITQWRLFGKWLDRHRPSVRRLHDLSERDYVAFAAHVRAAYPARASRVTALGAVSRLYGHTWQLPTDERPPATPWLSKHSLERYVGSTAKKGENSTKPIDRNALQPLLGWAMKLVNEFDETVDSPHPPVTRYLAYMGASLVVVAYLTGMRPKEVVTLPRDCLNVVESASGGIRYEVHGRAYKNVRDEDGRFVSAGQARPQPWLTIEQGARAIRVAQILSAQRDSTWLFAPSANAHSDTEDSGRGIKVSQAKGWIEGFVAYVNTHLAVASDGIGPIPVDGVGGLGLSRFRRTLAWHIANEPGGEVALGVQYGHLRVVTGQGYAGRAEAGLQDVIDLDEMMAVISLLDSLSDERADGGTFSGPAAPALKSALDRYSTEYAGGKMTDKELRRLLRVPGLQIYDNPQAATLCVFRPESAACQTTDTPGQERRTPALHDCRDNCANHAYTDAQVAEFTREQAALAAEVAVAPTPIAVRQEVRIELLQGRIDRHAQARGN